LLSQGIRLATGRQMIHMNNSDPAVPSSDSDGTNRVDAAAMDAWPAPTAPTTASSTTQDEAFDDDDDVDDEFVSADIVAPTHSRRRRFIAMGAVAALILGVGVGGGALGATAFSHGSSTTSTSQAAGTGTGTTGGTGTSGGTGTFGGSGSSTFGTFGGSNGFSGGSSSGSSGSSGSTGTTTTTGTAATASQQVGVVTVVSTLKYESAESAGTGIVLTSSGEILTNNHVVEGATTIKVTIATTGKTYTATVVGTDATHDIAVLQLKDASGLTTAKIASSAATTGDSVTAVGNAGGTGTLTQASGSVTALKQTITTAAEEGTSSEKLSGLIETNADVQSGDSGGPLLNSSGAVVGIDTAASTGTQDTTGYAITIAYALSIADKIVAGESSSDIVLGYPAFLGVETSATASSTSTTTSGATVAGVIDGTPAATAGIEANDVITAVGGTKVSSASALSGLVKKYSVGDRVSITYTDTAGASHTATVTLVSGPAA
jgi:S1-C subfamily serine protease